MQVTELHEADNTIIARLARIEDKLDVLINALADDAGIDDEELLMDLDGAYHDPGPEREEGL